MFWRLSQHRQSSDGVYQPLSPADVEAWCALADVRLHPWEWATIEAMDRARLQASGAETEPEMRTVVSADDGAGVVSLMRSFGARRERPQPKKAAPDG